MRAGSDPGTENQLFDLTNQDRTSNGLGALGVRRREEIRQTLARRWEMVGTKWGEVRIKIASMNGSVSNYAPEYEDCRRIAEEQKIPLKAVMMEAMDAYARSRKD